jgi:hypothetical protein
MAAVALIEEGDRRRDLEHAQLLRDRHAATRSRRPSCARRTVARVRARARSGLRGGRPAGHRSTSSASSSRSNPRRSDDDPPGEHARTPTDHDVAPAPRKGSRLSFAVLDPDRGGEQ